MSTSIEIVQNDREPRSIDKILSRCASEFAFIRCVVLFGGIVRDRVVLQGWSDLDLVVIMKGNFHRGIRSVSGALKAIESQVFLRIDPVFVLESELADPQLSRFYFNGAVINALDMSRGVGRVIYGDLPEVAFDLEREKLAAITYIDSTIAAFREFIFRYMTSDDVDCVYAIQRSARWCFSIIRAALRVFGVISHPYDEAIIHIERLFPNKDFTLLVSLTILRKNFQVEGVSCEMVYDIFDFVEEFREEFMRRIHEEAINEFRL